MSVIGRPPPNNGVNRSSAGEFGWFLHCYVRGPVTPIVMPYDITTLDIEDTCYAWREYRKRSRIFWAVFFSYIPGVLVIGVPLSRVLHSESVVGIVAIVWMAAFAVTGIY